MKWCQPKVYYPPLKASVEHMGVGEGGIEKRVETSVQHQNKTFKKHLVSSVLFMVQRWVWIECTGSTTDNT